MGNELFGQLHSKILKMKKLQNLIFLLAVLVGSLSAQTIDDIILEEMDLEDLPGLAACVVKDGEVVWMKSFGWANIENQVPVTDSTVFLLASVSKIFTATALMQLHESGAFELSEAINDYLPFEVKVPNFENIPITFQHLLTHTASLEDNWDVLETFYVDGDSPVALGDCLENYFATSGNDYDASANFYNATPGTQNNYTNMGAALIGYLAEVIAGKPFDQFCDEEIFEPLCMNTTAWKLVDLDISQIAVPYEWNDGLQPLEHYGVCDYPDGQLRSNIQDLANFMITYLQGGSFNSNAILEENSVNQMLSQQIPSIEASQGLIWYTENIGGESLWGHNGGEQGASTDLYINPAENLGIALIANGGGSMEFLLPEFYDFAKSLSASGVGNPSCAPTAVLDTRSPEIHLEIYPNPASSFLKVSLRNQSTTGLFYTIYDGMGKVVLKQKPFDPNINISTFNEGLYLLEIEGEGFRTSRMFLK